MRNAAFLEGNVTTSFADEVLSHPDQIQDHPVEEIAIVAAAIAQFEGSKISTRAAPATNAWKTRARLEALRS
jgi:hypothetical protein